MVAVGCTEGGVDDNIDNGGNNTEQPGGDTDDEAIEIPSNEIWYTTTDNKRIILPSTEPTVFGAYFISNTYSDGKGVLTFDDEITKIGNDAFKDIGNLASITIPDSVTSIGDYTFQECTSLTSVTIPDSVTSIGEYAFYWCTSLTSITIPDSVTEIGSSAFSHCTSLTSVTIANGVTSIGSSAFYGCTGELIVNGNIPNSAFCNSKFTKVTIGNGVTSIGEDAFYNCDSLTSVTIPNSVTLIGDDAFYKCTSLTSVYITDIAAWCNISFSGGVSNPLCYAGNLYLNNELVTDLIIPNSVTSIGKYAFYRCTSLESVTIPDSVTSIGNCAFIDCTSLEVVYCKPTTPPTGGDLMFYDNASGRNIYVPSNSVSAYKSANGWSDYASAIVGYDF